MDKFLIYDARHPVPEDIKTLLGVDVFAEVIYRKRSLQRWLEDTCIRAGLPAPIHLFRTSNVEQISRNVQIGPTTRNVILYFPAYLAFRSTESEAASFLQKLSLSKHNLTVQPKSIAQSTEFPPAISVLVDDTAKLFLEHLRAGLDAHSFLLKHSEKFALIPDDAGIIDLRDPLQFADFLTSNFDVRYFNQVRSENQFIVIKQSTDRVKIRREYSFYGLLPPELQMFFVQPFGLTENDRSASYKMERLFVPDMALQWIHGALSETQFQRFLEHIFFFIGARTRKNVGEKATKALREEIYLDKVQNRIQELQSNPVFPLIETYLRSTIGGLDSLHKRYLSLYQRLVSTINETSLCIGHGDLCFSNILYSKTTGLLKFIDPRGADHEVDLYMHPYYDLAKLSHSVLGNYDFINAGLYNLRIGTTLQVELEIETPARPWIRPMFERYLKDYGFDKALVRLYEASLFISMTPLHIDLPKKVLAFLIHADRLLSEIEHG